MPRQPFDPVDESQYRARRRRLAEERDRRFAAAEAQLAEERRVTIERLHRADDWIDVRAQLKMQTEIDAETHRPDLHRPDLDRVWALASDAEARGVAPVAVEDRHLAVDLWRLAHDAIALASKLDAGHGDHTIRSPGARAVQSIRERGAELAALTSSPRGAGAWQEAARDDFAVRLAPALHALFVEARAFYRREREKGGAVAPVRGKVAADLGRAVNFTLAQLGVSWPPGARDRVGFLIDDRLLWAKVDFPRRALRRRPNTEPRRLANEAAAMILAPFGVLPRTAKEGAPERVAGVALDLPRPELAALPYLKRLLSDRAA